MIEIITNNVTLKVDILGRRNDSNDFWDGNWLMSDIQVILPNCKATYKADIRTDELRRFYDELTSINIGSGKVANLETLEEGITIHCNLDTTGEIVCNCKAMLSLYAELRFRFSFHLGELESVLKKLYERPSKYPIIGSEPG